MQFAQPLLVRVNGGTARPCLRGLDAVQKDHAPAGAPGSLGQPLVQIAASVPATALFPVLLLLLIRAGGGMGIAAVFERVA